MTRRQQVLAGLLVSGGLLALVLSQLDLELAAARLGAVRWPWILAAVVASGGVLLARGLRFHALTTRSSLTEVTAAVAAQNLLNRVTPFRLGELSLPLLLKRVAEEPATPALVALLLVRLVELWALLGLATVTAALWFGGEGGLGELEGSRVAALAGIAVVLSGLLLTFRAWMRWGVSLAGRVAQRLGLMSVAAVKKLHARLLEALAGDARLSRRQHAWLLGGTAAMLAINYLMFHLLLSALGYDLHPVALVLAVTASQVTGALPVPSFGSFGTHEVGWTAGFVWVGMPMADAVLTGLLSHTALIVFASLFSLPAGLYLFRRGAL